MDKEPGTVPQRGRELAAMWAGAVAGAVEAIVTMPLEVTKTRQQLGPRQGLLASMRDSMQRAGGARGLYTGLPIQVLQTSGKVGIRFFVYGAVKQATPDPTLRAAGGVLAGVAEAFLWITPCERLKILRISQPDASLRAFSRSVFAEGLGGLWTGAAPTVLRNGATVGFRFYVYDAIVDRYCNGNAALGGAAVGALSSMINNPVDVTKSEMQAARGSTRYESMLHCARHLVQTKGWAHLLTAGVQARVLKIGLGQAVIFQVVQLLS